MKLKVLGSSSAGNCYLFDNGKEAFLYECGVSFPDVKHTVDFDIARIAGCVVSHEHGDHAKYVKQVMDAKIPLYLSQGTAAALDIKVDGRKVHAIGKNSSFGCGEFLIRAFDTQHDSAEPLGFVISHPEMGNVLCAIDTYYLRYKFRGLRHILIEYTVMQQLLFSS